jgi:hypothetical protein
MSHRIANLPLFQYRLSVIYLLLVNFVNFYCLLVK